MFENISTPCRCKTSPEQPSSSYYWLGTFLKTGFSNSPRQHGSWKRFTTSSFNTPLNTCHEHVHRTCENVSWKRLLKRCQYWTRFLKSYLERSWTCIAQFSWTCCLKRFLEHKYSTFFKRVLGHMTRTQFWEYVFLDTFLEHASWSPTDNLPTIGALFFRMDFPVPVLSRL